MRRFFIPCGGRCAGCFLMFAAARYFVEKMCFNMANNGSGTQAERLAHVIGAIQAGVMVVDSGLNLIYVNERMLEYFPCRAEEWRNLSVGEFLGCGGCEKGTPYHWREACGSCTLCGGILGMIRFQREMREFFYAQAYLHRGREEVKWYQAAGFLAGSRADCAALFFSGFTARPRCGE